LFYVLKQKRKHYNSYQETWQPVSLFDSNGNFRGAAIFETKRQAESYLKTYQKRLETRNDNNHSNNEASKISIKLQIFQEDQKPATSYSLFYKRR
jgi:hypothetical protein